MAANVGKNTSWKWKDVYERSQTYDKNQRRTNACLMLPQLQWWRMNSPQEKKCVFLNRDTQYTSQQRCKQDGSYCLVCVVYQCAFAFAFALVLRDADNKSSPATTTNLLPKKNRRVFRAQQGVDCLTPLLVFLSPQTPFIMQTPVNPAGPCGPQQRRGATIEVMPSKVQKWTKFRQRWGWVLKAKQSSEWAKGDPAGQTDHTREQPLLHWETGTRRTLYQNSPYL